MNPFQLVESTITDPQIQDAFDRPELYNWDSEPTLPEKIVMEALDEGSSYTSHCTLKALLDAALEQPEPIQITRCVDGYQVKKFIQ